MALKVTAWRSKKYRDWVKTLPSVISRKPAGDAHHIKAPGFGGTAKCCDAFVIPLTREEHMEFHQIGRESWERKYGVDQKTAVLRTLEIAFSEGKLKSP